MLIDQIALLLLVLIYFGLSSAKVVRVLRNFAANRARGTLLAAVLLLPYLLATFADQGIFNLDMARITIYVFFPILVLNFRSQRAKTLDIFDMITVLGIWLPVEFDWLPQTRVTLFSGLELPIALLIAICLGMLIYLVIRPLSGVGYTFLLRNTDLMHAMTALGAFAAIGMPLGIATGFIQPGTAPVNIGDWLVSLLAIYFLTALPEELLFRGVIQNMVETRFGRNLVTWIAAAAIFGLSHINNTTAHHTPPNWNYVVMAMLAGLAYGWAWRKSGKITASAITHTLVNFIWGVLFLG